MRPRSTDITNLAFPYSYIVQRPDSAVSYFEAYKNIGRKYTSLKQSDLAPTVLQAVVDVLEKGQSFFIKEGDYPFGTTQVTKSSDVASDLYFAIIGEGQPVGYGDIGTQRGVKIYYTGTDIPFKFAWTGANEGGYITLKNLAFYVTVASLGGVKLDMINGGTVKKLEIASEAVKANSKGLEIIGVSNASWVVEDVTCAKFYWGHYFDAQHILAKIIKAYSCYSGIRGTTASAHLCLINPYTGLIGGLDDYSNDIYLQGSATTIINPFLENHVAGYANNSGIKLTGDFSTVINPRFIGDWTDITKRSFASAKTVWIEPPVCETQTDDPWVDPTGDVWEGREVIVYNSTLTEYRKYCYINAGWRYVALS